MVEDIEEAMRRMDEAPYRVEHWPHHPHCTQKLTGNHIRCPHDREACSVCREEGA